MKVEVKVRNGVRVIHLEGHLTLGKGDLVLREAARGLLEAGHSRILLDLQGVISIDSSGLAEIIACKKRVLERGGILKLLKPPKRVYELLLMSRLTEIFEIHQDESEAVGTF